MSRQMPRDRSRKRIGLIAGAVLVAAALIGFVAVSGFAGTDDDPKATSTPTATAPTAPTTPGADKNLPSGVLDLTNWKITLPSGPKDDATEVEQPELKAFQDPPFFQVNPDKTGVIFQAPAGGSTTSGSGYPRSELREMADGGKSEADWSNESGTHTMTITQAITAAPKKKPDVVAGQIHDAEDDVVMVRLEGKHLFVEGDGNELGDLDNNYKLGTKFTVTVTATSAGIRVDYSSPGKKSSVVNYKKTGKGYYFKAGCYTQSNLEQGDKADSFGQVILYGLKVSHT